MSERDAFERRLETAVREFVATAPTDVDAARLTRSLATSTPRVRRLVALPVWRMPSLGLAWILFAAILLAMLGVGLVATGALRDVLRGPAPPPPTPVLETPPAVIVSPEATPSPAASAVPEATPAVSATPIASPSIGIVLPTGYRQDEALLREALVGAGYGAQVIASDDPASEKAAVEALIRQGIGILVLCPQDGTVAATAADEARAAGVKVIAYDRLVRGTAAVDHYLTFDNVGVGTAQARYLVEKAGATKGNNLYLYTGAPSDDNSFAFLEGAWETLQPRIADGTFVIRNSSAAVSLRGHATLTRAQQAAIIDQVTTSWDADAARGLAAGNLAGASVAAKGTVFVLAPNDITARAIAGAFAADPAVTRTYVTGQDAEKASVQAIIDGTQGMTVLKDPRTLVDAAVAAVGAFLRGGTPAAATTVANGAIEVPAQLVSVTAVTRDNVQAVLIDSGYYRAADFTGSWPGKP
jgi:putative multiple sugar transport system substrate-binding protein